MTIQQTYGSFVNKLPIANKSKNFLLRNWKGFVLGAIYGGFGFFYSMMVSKSILFFPPFLVGAPIFLYSFFGRGGSPIPLLLFITLVIGILFGLIGAYIQSLIRRHK